MVPGALCVQNGLRACAAMQQFPRHREIRESGHSTVCSPHSTAWPLQVYLFSGDNATSHSELVQWLCVQDYGVGWRRWRCRRECGRQEVPQKTLRDLSRGRPSECKVYERFKLHLQYIILSAIYHLPTIHPSTCLSSMFVSVCTRTY
jgi:hypothetical protein